MRASLPLLGACLGLFIAGCADDTANDDLFAEATDPTFAAGTGDDARAGASTSGDPGGQPSGGAGGTSGGIVTASGESSGPGSGSGSGSGSDEGSGSGAGTGPGAGVGTGGGVGGSGSGSGGGGGGASDLSADVRICGRLDAFAAAGVNDGSCTIAGVTLPIAAGATLTGQVLATVGVGVCLDAKLDANGRVKASSVLSLDLALGAQARAKACGKVHAYVAASSSTDGSVAVGGAGFAIDAGTSIAAESKLVVDASVCVDAKLDGSGAIVAASVSSN